MNDDDALAVVCKQSWHVAVVYALNMYIGDGLRELLILY